MYLDDANNEEFLLKKSEEIIKKKLKTMSLKQLMKDGEFRDSIFQRFAVLKLPLREGVSWAHAFKASLKFCISEDISVAEVSAVKRVVEENILSTVTETRSLLAELKNSIQEIDLDNRNVRSERLRVARNQLQKLLDITLSSE